MREKGRRKALARLIRLKTKVLVAGLYLFFEMIRFLVLPVAREQSTLREQEEKNVAGTPPSW